MALQINRRHLKFDLAEYLKASESGHWPEAESPKNTNLIKWSEFQNGPIRETDVQGWLNVPFTKRGASLAYSRHGDELGFDHQTKATMPEGNGYTLFPCGSERWNDRYVQGFVLFSNNPLPNGKRVMFFYLDEQVMKRALGPTL
jgi:hypothetical protein